MSSTISPSFRVFRAGPNNSRRYASLVVQEGSNLLPLTDTDAMGKFNVKCLMDYDESSGTLVPAMIPLDQECLCKAGTICPGKTLILCLTENPPRSIQPTVCGEIYNVTITPDSEFLSTQFVLEIEVPLSGGFSLKYRDYIINLADGVISIGY